MEKSLVDNIIKESKQLQEHKERCKANFIDFNNYFKYSGRVEPNRILISHWKYNHNFKSGNQLHEQFIKKQEYENNKKNAGKLSKGFDAYYWYKAEGSVHRD